MPVAELPLSQTVDASRFERSWRSSVLGLLTSIVVQGLAITTLIVTPLLVTQTMPEPVSQLTLPPFVAVQVEPPIERGPDPPPDARPPVRGYEPPNRVDVIVAPMEIPDGIPESPPYFSQGDPMGVPGGLPASLGGRPLPPKPAPEPAAEPEPILIIGDVRPPRKVVHVSPVYPRIALNAHIQGTVKLQAVIDAEGRVSNLSVIHSIALLDRAAIEAVQQWRYQPTFLNGRAVPVIMTVEVKFRLR